MRIDHSLRASKTPAFALLAEGWNEIVQEGFTPEGAGVYPVKSDDEVLFAVSDEGDIVGVIAFGVSAGNCTISLAYVEPSSRRRGLFKALLSALKHRSAEYGVDSIQMHVPTENSLFQTVMRHVNVQAATVTYELLG